MAILKDLIDILHTALRIIPVIGVNVLNGLRVNHHLVSLIVLLLREGRGKEILRGGLEEGILVEGVLRLQGGSGCGLWLGSSCNNTCYFVEDPYSSWCWSCSGGCWSGDSSCLLIILINKHQIGWL